ncbi:MAG: BamA/TamA family outer membrane protein [Bacteroidales bacterium]
MQIIKRISLTFLAILAIYSTTNAQRVDTLIVDGPSKEPMVELPVNAKKSKNFKYSILGGPGYTPDFGFVVGGSFLTTFSTAPSDSTLLRSVLPLSFGLTFGRRVGFNFMLYPQLYFKGDRFRLTGRFIFKNAADNYYGVGFANNKSIERGGETTGYYASTVQINPVGYFRIKETPIFVGPMVDIVYDRMSDISKGVAADEYYIKQNGDTTGLNMLSTTVGVAASYDTRDVPANAYKGLYFDVKLGYAPKFLGSDHEFGQLSIDYRQYLKVGERRTLAWTVNTKNAFGDVPLTRMPMVGSPFDLRGYYLGQYRDNSTSLMLVEYRHMFNNDRSTKMKRFWSRFGFATWAGVGVMGPSIAEIDAVLPNFGAGLRVEVQPRMNFRLDLGYSTREKQTLIYFNITEAF